MSDDALTIGEIGRTLERLDEGQKAIIVRIDLMRGEFVHRTEWDLQRRVDTQERAEVEDALRTLRRDVGLHHDTLSRVKGILWLAGALLGVALGILGAYIQSGRI